MMLTCGKMCGSLGTGAAAACGAGAAAAARAASWRLPLGVLAILKAVATALEGDCSGEAWGESRSPDPAGEGVLVPSREPPCAGCQGLSAQQPTHV